MKDSLLENTLLKDLFLRHNVQVGKRCIQEVEVCIFIDSPEGEKTPSEPESKKAKRKEKENLHNRQKEKQSFYQIG